MNRETGPRNTVRVGADEDVTRDARLGASLRASQELRSDQVGLPPAHGPDLVARNRLLQQVEDRLFSGPSKERSPTLKSRYALTELLGAGGMGVVYAAFDPVLEREVAVKFVKTSSALATQDLLREARALAQLAHPAVVPVYDVGEYDPREFEVLGHLQADGFEPTFVVMERVQGSTIDRWLEETSPTQADIIRVFVQAASGLAAAHAVGVVHRDFKPSNVMVSEAGRARVLDFGLARRVGDGGPRLDPEEVSTTDAVHSDRTMVQTGVVVGTPAYMSPEQHRGAHGDARSDQYSFSIALCEAVTGTRLFRGTRASELSRQKARGEIVTSATSSLPRRLRQVIRRAASPKPDERYPSMADVATALESVVQGRRRWVLVAGASFFGGTALAASLPEHEDRDCEIEAEEAMTSTWNEARGAELSSVFERSSASYAQTSWDTTREALDEFSEQWVERKARACRIGAADSTPTPEAACLDHQRDYVSAIVTVLAQGNATVVASAVSLLEFLPRLDDCASAHRSSAYRVEATSLAIAQARLLENAGDGGAALDLLSSELSMHVDVPSPSSAALHLRRSSVALKNGDPSTAEADANRAWELAEQSGDTRLASRAMLQLVAVRRAQARYSEGDSLLKVLAARAQASASEDVLHARVLTERGRIAWGQAENSEAVALFDQAEDAWIEARGPDAVALTGIRRTKAMVLARQGDFDGAVTLLNKVYDQQRRRLGEGHPHLASFEDDLGYVFREARQPRVALRHFNLGMAILRDAGVSAGFTRADILEGAAAVELELGRSISAESFALELVKDREKRWGHAHPEIADAYSTLALARSQRGDPQGSLEALESAQRANENSAETSMAVMGLIRALQCDAQMQMGESEAAVELCRAAVSVWSRASQGPDVALLGMIYAVALAQNGQVPFALEEAKRARDVLDMPDLPWVARAQGAMLEGEVFLAAGMFGEAATRFVEARSLLQADPDMVPPEWVRVNLRLATLAALSGDRVRAEAFAREGSEFSVSRALELDHAAACDAMLSVVVSKFRRSESRALRRRSRQQWERLGTHEAVLAEHEGWMRRVRESLSG
jgi:serine/threonine protein kinase